MKLYATTTSERASKGQGGNEYINIDLMRGSASDSKKCYRLHFTEKSITILKNGNVIFQELSEEKGERQKGETMTYFCTECGHIESWSAKLYSEKGEPVCPNDDNDMTLQ